MESKDKIHESHQDNDGILEYDNPLPDWFVYLFLGTIVFACLYSAYAYGHSWGTSRYSNTGANLSSTGTALAFAQREAEERYAPARKAEPVGAELAGLLKAPPAISAGEAVFKANCVACHGDQGQGVVGPNLVDAYWIHGGSPEALVLSIGNGYPDKGMPAWKPVLGPEKVRQAAAYILSIRGRPVHNPKEAQGTLEP
jgi:cytochrome c oxidase cbb3-type subunit 3